MDIRPVDESPDEEITRLKAEIAERQDRLHDLGAGVIAPTEGRAAFYFGCRHQPGHYLFDANGRKLWNGIPGCPWDLTLMDGGLLKNGGRRDYADGRVFWTCGGRGGPGRLWFAFYWWDNSVDRRPGSNSGFYVSGYDGDRAALEQVEDAFEFALRSFPEVVGRQVFMLVLQKDAHKRTVGS